MHATTYRQIKLINTDTDINTHRETTFNTHSRRTLVSRHADEHADIHINRRRRTHAHKQTKKHRNIPRQTHRSSFSRKCGRLGLDTPPWSYPSVRVLSISDSDPLLVPIPFTIGYLEFHDDRLYLLRYRNLCHGPGQLLGGQHVTRFLRRTKGGSALRLMAWTHTAVQPTPIVGYHIHRRRVRPLGNRET